MAKNKLTKEQKENLAFDIAANYYALIEAELKEKGLSVEEYKDVFTNMAGNFSFMVCCKCSGDAHEMITRAGMIASNVTTSAAHAALDISETFIREEYEGPAEN